MVGKDQEWWGVSFGVKLKDPSIWDGAEDVCWWEERSSSSIVFFVSWGQFVTKLSLMSPPRSSSTID